MTGDLIQAAKFIGAGLSMIGALGAGIRIGLECSRSTQWYGPKPGCLW